MIRKIYEWVLNIIFPIKCISCGIPDTMFCETCISRVKKPDAILDTYIYAFGSYKDKHIKRALWLLKFHNRKSLATIFGKQLHDLLLEEMYDQITFENFKNPILIPIPLSKKRLHERGYNQAELLAIAIAKSSANLFSIETKALFKTRDTERQALVRERSKRLQNLKGCFRAKQNYVRGKNIILVDDITTTGTTIREARTALKKAGARKVIAVTVAH